MLRAFVVLFGMIGTIWADPTLTFTLAPGGTVSYAGGATPINGTSIPVSSITGSGTLRDGTLAVTSGVLTFTSGNFNGNASGGILHFSGTGTFTLTGAIAGVTPGIVTLLNGNFLAATFDSTCNATPGCAATLSLFLTTGQDTKHQSLVNYFFGTGATVNWAFGATVFVDKATGNLKKVGFSQAALGGDVVNTATSVTLPPSVSSAPEPSSIVLLATTAGVLGYVVRRRKRP